MSNFSNEEKTSYLIKKSLGRIMTNKDTPWYTEPLSALRIRPSNIMKTDIPNWPKVSKYFIIDPSGSRVTTYRVSDIIDGYFTINETELNNLPEYWNGTNIGKKWFCSFIANDLGINLSNISSLNKQTLLENSYSGLELWDSNRNTKVANMRLYMQVPTYQDGTISSDNMAFRSLLLKNTLGTEVNFTVNISTYDRNKAINPGEYDWFIESIPGYINFYGLTDGNLNNDVNEEKPPYVSFIKYVGEMAYASDSDTGAWGNTIESADKTANFSVADNNATVTVNNQKRLIIDSSGNIGINTSLPNYILDISHNGAIKIPVGDNSGRPIIVNDGLIRYNTDTKQFEGYSNKAWQGLGGVIDKNLDTKIIAEDTDNLRFFTKDKERMTINNLGNVGIGTNDISNNFILDVGGDTNISGSLTINENETIKGSLNVLNSAVLGSANIGSTVMSSSSVTNGLTVGGVTNLSNTNINGNIDLLGDQKINGNLDLIGKVNISGETLLDGSTNIIGDIDISGEGNIFLKGDMTILGNIDIAGSFNQKNINVTVEEKTTEQMIVTNDGTGPALIINQIGNEKIAEFKDDGKAVLTIDNSGVIGVNVSAPIYTIDISSNDAIRLPVGSSNQRPNIVNDGLIRYNTDTKQFEGYSNEAWQGLGGVIDKNLDTKIIAEDSDNLRFFTKDKERMIIDNSGNIGIGTNLLSSDTVLTISGNTEIINGDLKITNNLNVQNLNVYNELTSHSNTLTSHQSILSNHDASINELYRGGGKQTGLDLFTELMLDKSPIITDISYNNYPDRIEITWKNPNQQGTGIPIPGLSQTEYLFLPFVNDIIIEYGTIENGFNTTYVIGGKEIYNQNKASEMTNKFIIYIDNAILPESISGDEETIGRVLNKTYYTKPGGVNTTNTYNFRVYASNNDPDSIINYAVLNNITTEPVSTSSAPRDLSYNIIFDGETKLILEWTKPLENVKGYEMFNEVIKIKEYKIEYQQGNIVNDYADISQTWIIETNDYGHQDISKQTYTKILPLDDNKWYNIRVKSNNTGNFTFSEPSNIVEFRPYRLNIPNNLNASIINDTLIRFTWNKPIDSSGINTTKIPIYKYKLLIDENNDNTYDNEIEITNNITDSQTIESYDYNTLNEHGKDPIYNFVLLAKNALVSGYSDISLNNSVNIDPGFPGLARNLKIKFFETNNNDYVRFSWDTPSNMNNLNIKKYEITYFDGEVNITDNILSTPNIPCDTFYDFYYDNNKLKNDSFSFSIRSQNHFNNLNYSNLASSENITPDVPSEPLLNLELYNDFIMLKMSKPLITDINFNINPDLFEDETVIDISDYIITPNISDISLQNITLIGNNNNIDISMDNQIFDNLNETQYKFSSKARNVFNTQYSENEIVKFNLSKPDNFIKNDILIDWEHDKGINISVNYPSNILNISNLNIASKVNIYHDQLKIEVNGIPNNIVSDYQDSFNDKILHNLIQDTTYIVNVKARNKYINSYNDTISKTLQVKVPNKVTNISVTKNDIKHTSSKNEIEFNWQDPSEKGLFVEGLSINSPNIYNYILVLNNLDDNSEKYDIDITATDDSVNPDLTGLFKTGNNSNSHGEINIKPETNYRLDIKSSNAYYKNSFSSIESKTLITLAPRNPNAFDVIPETAVNKLSIQGNHPIIIESLIDDNKYYNNIINNSDYSTLQISNNNQVNRIGNITMLDNISSSINTLSLNNTIGLTNDTLSFKLIIKDIDNNNNYISNEIKYSKDSTDINKFFTISGNNIGSVNSNNIIDVFTQSGYDINNIGYWYQGTFFFTINFSNFTHNYLGRPLNINTKISYYDLTDTLEGSYDSSFNINGLDNFNTSTLSYLTNSIVTHNEFKIFGIPYIKKSSIFSIDLSYDILGVSKYYVITPLSIIKLKSDTRDYSNSIKIESLNANFDENNAKWSLISSINSNLVLSYSSVYDNQIKINITHSNINNFTNTILEDKIFIYDSETFDLYDQQLNLNINTFNTSLIMNIPENIDPISNFDSVINNLNTKTNFVISNNNLSLCQGKFITPVYLNTKINLQDASIINKYNLTDMTSYVSDNNYRYCMFKYNYKHNGNKVDLSSFGFKLVNTNILLSDIQVNNDPNVRIFVKLSYDNEETIWYKLNSNSGANPGSTATIIGNNDYPYNGLVNLTNGGENPLSIPNTIDGKTFMNWSSGNENIYSYAHVFKNIQNTSPPVSFYILIGLKNNINRYIGGIQFLGINI